MKRSWFKEFSWIYVPTTWQGLLITALVLAFCLQVFIAVDNHSESVSDTLYGIFPYIVPALGIFLWIGSKTTTKRK